MQPVIDKLRTITAIDIAPRLDEQSQVVDSFAGIVIVELPEHGSVVALDGREYRFHAARVFPGKHVNPHFHTTGQEPYEILAGEQAIMHVGTVDGQAVSWTQATAKPGDEMIMRGNEVHSLENVGNTPVDFAFACPDSHLNEQDRVFTTDYENSLPRYQE